MTISQIPDYVTPQYLESLNLRSGCGDGTSGDRCAWQEFRAWAGLDPKSWECPPTASPVLHRFTVDIQDASAMWRKRLAPEFGAALLFAARAARVASDENIGRRSQRSWLSC